MIAVKSDGKGSDVTVGSSVAEEGEISMEWIFLGCLPGGAAVDREGERRRLDWEADRRQLLYREADLRRRRFDGRRRSGGAWTGWRRGGGDEDECALCFSGRSPGSAARTLFEGRRRGACRRCCYGGGSAPLPGAGARGRSCCGGGEGGGGAGRRSDAGEAQGAAGPARSHAFSGRRVVPQILGKKRASSTIRDELEDTAASGTRLKNRYC
ncbi:unnamed protein product [Urochloa humidicola]